MSTTGSVKMSPQERAERQALRRRVQRFYQRFNKEEWKDCFALIDPQLIQKGKVEFSVYADLMRAFKDEYGGINPRWTNLSLHLGALPRQKDKRPFAYVYVLWQDHAYGFHMFRERWVLEKGRWYTRVVGLVPNRREAAPRQAG